MKFAIVKSFAPLLNTADFHAVFKHPLPLDKEGLLRAVETIALPGTPLRLIQKCNEHIYQVVAPGYPKTPLFADTRFLTERASSLKPKEIKCPPPERLLERLNSLLGVPYIWGGNRHLGIPELLTFYPPSHPLDPISQKKWTLQGLDCSGLLHQVSGGFTPRNTSQLINFGHPLPIEGKPLAEIASQLLPLDLIVWVGHVIIVFDQHTTIESSCPRGGVVTTPLHTRLAEILKTRSPHNTWKDPTSFVIRRFIIEKNS